MECTIKMEAVDGKTRRRDTGERGTYTRGWRAYILDSMGRQLWRFSIAPTESIAWTVARNWLRDRGYIEKAAIAA